MRLVEFALQGVRRFEAGRKLAFGEGYNLVTGPNESGKTTCLLAILAALEPERLEGETAGLLPAPAAGAPIQPPPRCGLVFVHDDHTFRLVRDLVQGAANLGVLDPGSGKFVPQQRDADAIRRWLREVAGMPGRRLFDLLFLLERGAMPSARLRGASARAAPAPAAAGEAGIGDSFGGSVAPAAAFLPTGAAREARIAELKAELARIEEMGQLEFRLDGVKARLFEIDAEFADVKKLDALAGELDAAIAEFEGLGLDPAQLETRARSFKTLVERRATDLAAVEADREALEARAAAPVTPVHQDRLVLAGTAGALVCLVAGALVPAAFSAAAFTGALAGLGTAAFGVVRDSRAAARRRDALAGLAALDERVQAIEKRFEIETRSVRSAQEALGVSGPEGLLERVEAYRTARRRRESVGERREAVTRQKDFSAFEAERGRLAAEVDQLEERLRGFGGTAAFDAGELQRELAVLEGREAPGEGAARVPGAAAGLSSAGAGDELPLADGPGAGTATAGAAAGGPLREALESWLEAAARLLGESREEVARELLRKAQPIVAPITADRHRSMALDADGRLVAVAPDGRTSPAAALSPATQDALYLALRLAGFVLVARRHPWPLFLDDPLVALDDARLAAACRAIRAAARVGGQVLHLAARKLPPALADSAQALG